MNKQKINEKGITLIALVITIIVLLILAGVAINMAIDSDGLFGKAKEAAESWNTAVAEEERAVENILEQYKEIMGGNSGGSGDGDDDGNDDNLPALPAGWDSEKVVDVVTEGTRKAPIPVGYVASQIETEDEISEGLVIYQGTEAVTGTAGNESHNTAMTTRNQFIWIPVDDINQMVMCKSNTSSSVCNLVLQTDGTLKCEIHNSTALCGRLYGTESKMLGNESTDIEPEGPGGPLGEDSEKQGTIYSTSMNFADRTQTWSLSDYREPDIVSTYDINGETSYLIAAGVSTASELASQLTTDFTSMATSVAKYGGFYVSRYEVGVVEDENGEIIEKGISKKDKKVLVAGTSTEMATGYDTNTFVNGNMWYGMYNILRTTSAIDKTAVNLHMIWGSQYDMIIKYLGENSLNEPQIGHTDRQLATQELTGETTIDIMSNIYDLEGNNYEWTAQAYTSSFRVFRGGGFWKVTELLKFGPASNLGSVNPGESDCKYGSRMTLYL